MKKLLFKGKSTAKLNHWSADVGQSKMSWVRSCTKWCLLSTVAVRFFFLKAGCSVFQCRLYVTNKYFLLNPEKNWRRSVLSLWRKTQKSL